MLSPKVIIAFWYFLVSDAQLQSSVERSCPGETVTFTCTVPSIAHLWQVSVFGITRSFIPVDQGGVISDPPFQFNVTEVRTGTSITSTATVTATADLNGTLIVCRDGLGMLSDQSSIINVRGESGVNLVCVQLVSYLLADHFAQHTLANCRLQIVVNGKKVLYLELLPAARLIS